MRNILSGVLLGSADLLDDYVMKNAFEYEEELAELRATIAELETKLNNAINLDFERRAEIERLNITRPVHANAPADSGTHPHNDGLDDYRREV